MAKPPVPQPPDRPETNATRQGPSPQVIVLDTWPKHVPVTSAELEAIETWLAPLLDQILGDSDA